MLTLLTGRIVRCDRSELKTGDIIGFSPNDLISWGINLGTYGVPGWGLAHVGIIGEHDGRQLLFESTSSPYGDCVIQGRRVNGSQATWLDSAIDNCNGFVWHYPLYRRLYEAERTRLNTFLHATLGIPYDVVGAFRAGGYFHSGLQAFFHGQDLNALFCSEWCAAAHAEVGILPSTVAGRWNPNLLVRRERRLGLLAKPVRLK